MASRHSTVADARFLTSLGGLAGVLEETAAVVYGVWADLRLAYLGPGWFAFSEDNGGPEIPEQWPLGRSVAEAWQPPLDAYYRELFERALKSAQPLSHDYECSSAITHRRFRMTLSPVRDQAGLVVVNSLLVEQPHDPAERSPIDLPVDHYVDALGHVTQCMHCRRTKRVAGAPRWDWVPSLVEHMPARTTHGLCEICLEYYYPPNGPR